MRKLLLFLACLVLALPTFAQSHSVSLSWGVSGITGVNYHVYRAPCSGSITSGICTSEGTFAVVASPTGNTYTDSTVTAGAAYSYYVTAFCAATCQAGYSGESIPSNHAGAQVSANSPPPPGNLVIGTVAYNFSNGRTTVAGNWTAPAGDVTQWYVQQGSFTLGTGTLFSPDGAYVMKWGTNGKVKPPLVLTVCDGLTCASKTAS